MVKNEKIRKALINEGHNPDKIMREFLVEQMKSQTGEGRSEFFRKGGEEIMLSEPHKLAKEVLEDFPLKPI